MKTLVILATVLGPAFSSPTGSNTLENFCPHLSTNAQIIWQVPASQLPKSFWTYKRLPPRPFSAAVISNAMVLASLQDKGIPKPSTNRIIIWDHTRKGDDPLAGSLAILPDIANIFFKVRNHALGSPGNIPSDEIILKQAWECASQLGVDRSQLIQRTISTNFCDYDQNGRIATNDACGREIVLSRVIDGISFYDGTEGFSIEFGSHGTIRSFSLDWPTLERSERLQATSADQIISCVKAHKIILIPNDQESSDYYAMLKQLAGAKTFTITKITPYYGDGIYGEVPRWGEPSKVATPYAELEAVADFGNSNLTVRLFSPVLKSDATRLLGK